MELSFEVDAPEDVPSRGGTTTGGTPGVEVLWQSGKRSIELEFLWFKGSPDVGGPCGVAARPDAPRHMMDARLAAQQTESSESSADPPLSRLGRNDDPLGQELRTANGKPPLDGTGAAERP